MSTSGLEVWADEPPRSSPHRAPRTPLDRVSHSFPALTRPLLAACVRFCNRLLQAGGSARRLRRVRADLAAGGGLLWDLVHCVAAHREWLAGETVLGALDFVSLFSDLFHLCLVFVLGLEWAGGMAGGRCALMSNFFFFFFFFFFCV
jgi:hypothetical protein